MFIPENNHQIIVIDNFLKNPEDLRNLGLSLPYEKTPGHANGNPGWVGITNLKLPQISKTAYYLIDNYYVIPHNDKIHYQFNVFEGGMPCLNTNFYPHVDPALYAVQIYLNDPEDCKGGTRFYKHLPTGLDINVAYMDEDFKKTQEFSKFLDYYTEQSKNKYNTILDSRQIDSSVWENTFEVEMKYNRLVIYPSYLFHGAYIEKEWFKDTKRMGIVGFVK